MNSHQKILGLTLLMIICIGIFNVAGQRNIDQIFRKYKNDEGVVNLNFTGDVKKYLSSSNVKLESEIDNIDVLIFEDGKNISTKDKKEITDVLIREQFDILIDVKDKSEKIKLHTKETGSYLSKVYAHVQSDESNIYFVISGKIKLEELSKLNLNFEGSDALKKIGKK